MPVEVAPRARRRRVKGQSTFDRIRQPQTKILHDFQSILYEVVGGKMRKFYYTATLQQANFITRFLRVTSMNSIYYQQSELSVIKEAHNLKQQSSESRKIRGEADAISTQRPFFLSLNSHIFFFVVDQC